MSETGERGGRVGVTESGRLLTDLQEIMEFDARLWEVTKELALRTGSVLRVPSESYVNWGIGITDSNRADLKRLADQYRQKDRDERQAGMGTAAEKTELVRQTRSAMAMTLAYIVKELITAGDYEKGEIHICDLAAGHARAASAVANALKSEQGVLARTVFHLVDLNGSKLDKDKHSLSCFNPAAIKCYPMNDEDFLGEHEGQLDIILSLGRLHKKSFPDVYGGIARSLKEGGSLVSADWHSSLCDNPEHIYRLMERMRIGTRRLEMFQDLFGNGLRRLPIEG